MKAAVVNHLSPKKLLNTKWTAVTPVNREKHFLVTAVRRDAFQHPVTVTLEAVHTRHETDMHWRELRDAGRWKAGWL